MIQTLYLSLTHYPIMIHLEEFFHDFSQISLVLCFLQVLKHKICVWLNTLTLASQSSENPPKNKNLSSKITRKIAIYGGLVMNGSDDSRVDQVSEIKRISKLGKRPAMLVVPVNRPAGLEFCDAVRKEKKKDFEVEGRGFCLASKNGKREFMEDGFGIMLDIMGDTKQAFFAVIDGHGGCAAAEYVAANLGKNIVKELECTGRAAGQVEALMQRCYSVTDKEFLAQGINGGACVAGVLLKDGELHVANVGDCRVVLSRNGEPVPLTNDQRLSREDERYRIEKSGGYVDIRHGVWRVNGSLAVSRAIGDLHLKEWVISEPEYQKFPITSDFEFLIMASDGLWDKVSNQEAVDVVGRDSISLESCRKLVDLSCSRGNLDDTTVIVINLRKFVQSCG